MGLKYAIMLMMLMAYALDSSSDPFDLTSLALQKLNIALTKYKDIIKGYDNFHRFHLRVLQTMLQEMQ